MAFHVDRSGKLRPTEAEAEKACIELLQHYGWRCHRLHTELIHTRRGGRRMVGEPHQPDWIVTKPAGWFYLEMKRPGGKPTKGQLAWHSEATRDGCVVIVASSIPELINSMKEQGFDL